MISVELGGEGDLKNQMQENIKKWGGDFNLNGEYHDYNVVKLAEHYMKKSNHKSALEVLNELLQCTHPSIVRLFTRLRGLDLSRHGLDRDFWSRQFEK
jgi:hypothetical protein